MVFTSPASDILKRHGFEEVRRHVSHVVMQKKIAGSTITIPVPDHKEIRKEHSWELPGSPESAKKIFI